MADVTRTKPPLPAGWESGEYRRDQDKTPAELKADIRHTRHRMDQDLAAIGAKLRPSRLKRPAKVVLGILALGAMIRAAIRKWT
jgi:hypothetical protein